MQRPLTRYAVRHCHAKPPDGHGDDHPNHVDRTEQTASIIHDLKCTQRRRQMPDHGDERNRQSDGTDDERAWPRAIEGLQYDGDDRRADEPGDDDGELDRLERSNEESGHDRRGDRRADPQPAGNVADPAQHESDSGDSREADDELRGNDDRARIEEGDERRMNERSEIESPRGDAERQQAYRRTL